MKNGRSIGKAFEQAIARDLRAWLGVDWLVLRTQTDRQQGETGHAGEFTIEHPAVKFPFAIECKDHASFAYAHLWKSPIPGPFLAFWTQAVRQAEAVDGARPMLILKEKRGEILVVVRLLDDHILLSDGVVSARQYAVLDIENDVLLVSRWSAVLASEPDWLTLTRPL